MKLAFFLLGSFFLTNLAFAAEAPNNIHPLKKKVERKLYVGKDSTEATMSFRFAVEINSSRPPSATKAHEQIEAQLSHLFGPMGEAKQKAVPKGDHEVSILSTKKKEDGVYSVEYTYEGTIVVHIPPSGLGNSYTITIPYNPGTIYEESAVGSKYPCTDHHYQSEGDFWYFWNPKNPGCKLKEGTHYERLETKIVERPNTRISYPEYANLVNSDGEITVSVLMGMDEPDKDKNPLTSPDTNAVNYKEIRQTLLNTGYEGRKWTREEIKAIAGAAGGPIPFVEEFTKKLSKATLRVRMFFGPSGINEESGHFHYFFKDALENASIMVYDGHSGLGGHLDLASIEENEGFKIKLPKDQYQIYFFNSCSSYSYYNTMFFAPKATSSDPRGTKKLDILTNGLATYFYVMHNTNMELIKSVEAWASNKGSVSYQAIAKKIDSGNLFGVNGDEDNPTKP